MKNTTPPFIVNDDILTAGPTRQLLMRWKNGKKECAPRSSSTIICTPTMAGGEYTCDEREWFCHGAVQVRYVYYKSVFFLPYHPLPLLLLVDVRYTRKTFPFQNLECHLQVYFIVDLICLSPYEQFIFLKNF